MGTNTIISIFWLGWITLAFFFPIGCLKTKQTNLRTVKKADCNQRITIKALMLNVFIFNACLAALLP
ncbi:hypothetical protein RNAN_1461 [Rheinheimera nanhaiensis E407-8]|uniref:Uncharacterized protein n=1 Tax=Rheinheimera nanhaiensis E407-8 TaxID=562729 RepID=I1DWR0_9GAMM|nr:hypothetical protein RNAN_1461 [Rheinheimera nanhaiensis E407-8]